jgi:uncharacterized protein
MAHGTSATIPMGADRYAESLVEGGLAVLLYDHRGFGISGGEPRQVLNPWAQARGLIDAIAFAERCDEVDASRIGLWGVSFGGGMSIVVAACDHRPRALVAQVPAFGPELPPSDENGALFETMRSTLATGDIWREPLTKTGPLPVVAADQLNGRSLFSQLTAFRWFMEYGGRHGSHWHNEITRVLPSTPVPYHAGLCAPHVAIPALWIIATDDEMPGSNPLVSRAAFEASRGRKELTTIEGGHFSALYPGAIFEQVSRLEREFLVRELSAGD